MLAIDVAFGMLFQALAPSGSLEHQRRILQPKLFLCERLGLPLNWAWRPEANGPFSLDLHRYLIHMLPELLQANFEPCHLTPKAAEITDSINALEVHMPGQASPASWYALLAAVEYARGEQAETLDVNEAAEHLVHIMPDVGKRSDIEMAWDVLRDVGIIPEGPGSEGKDEL